MPALSFDELVQMGLDLRASSDGLNWELGDLADTVSKQLEPKEFSKYAKAIGIPVPTFKRCRDIARAYPVEIRNEYALLSWSHFRRVAALNDRNEWLAKAVDNNWSVEKLYLAAKEKLAVDELEDIPARPEMVWCSGCRKWAFKHLEDYGRICPKQARCNENLPTPTEAKPN